VIYVVVMECLISLPLLIHTELSMKESELESELEF
jgi:hypothetical protein